MMTGRPVMRFTFDPVPGCDPVIGLWLARGRESDAAMRLGTYRGRR
ncbi:MAG: hypothetical protein ACFB51_16935 [Anaerolineae bacterium]